MKRVGVKGGRSLSEQVLTYRESLVGGEQHIGPERLAAQVYARVPAERDLFSHGL